MDDGVERTLGLMEGDDERISGSNATPTRVVSVIAYMPRTTTCK
jgi:hypothetical protein